MTKTTADADRAPCSECSKSAKSHSKAAIRKEPGGGQRVKGGLASAEKPVTLTSVLRFTTTTKFGISIQDEALIARFFRSAQPRFVLLSKVRAFAHRFNDGEIIDGHPTLTSSSPTPGPFAMDGDRFDRLYGAKLVVPMEVVRRRTLQMVEFRDRAPTKAFDNTLHRDDKELNDAYTVLHVVPLEALGIVDVVVGPDGQRSGARTVIQQSFDTKNAGAWMRELDGFAHVIGGDNAPPAESSEEKQ